ncbi:MAG: DNA adenine methylase [bacterium]
MTARPVSNIHKPLPHTFDEVLIGIANEQKPLVETINAKPFLKWVGGKRSVLPKLLERLPDSYNSYFEPFAGGGALYFELQPATAYISDINFYLIITYKAVRDNVDELVKLLKAHEKKHDKEYFLKTRARLSTERDQIKIASIFIYLNKTCFNGLYRVNKKGGFNVPIGSYKNPNIVSEDNLRACSEVLQGATISQHSFEQVKIKKGAFYYIDPPYHQTYSQYDGSGFGDEEHTKLADFCHKIDKAGGFFMVSNSDTKLVRTLYKGYTIDEVQASRSVSCKAHQRGKEYELIIRNYTRSDGK